MSTDDTATSGAGGAAQITYAALTDRSHVITGLAWSYTDTPTGTLKIEDGSGNVTFSVSITTSGPGFFIFPEPKKGTTNTDMIITLAASGGSIVAKVNALNHWTE